MVSTPRAASAAECASLKSAGKISACAFLPNACSSFSRDRPTARKRTPRRSSSAPTALPMAPAAPKIATFSICNRVAREAWASCTHSGKPQTSQRRARRAQDSSPRRRAVGSRRAAFASPGTGRKKGPTGRTFRPVPGLGRDRRSPSADALGYYLTPCGLQDSSRTSRRCTPTKKAGRLVAARLFRFTGSGYLTNTEMVPLTVWPPGPYAVKVYTELVIGVTVRLPLEGSVCAGISLPIRTTEVAVCVVQERTTGLPAAVEVTGLAVNEVIFTEPTVSVVLAWIWPVALVAVRV